MYSYVCWSRSCNYTSGWQFPAVPAVPCREQTATLYHSRVAAPASGELASVCVICIYCHMEVSVASQPNIMCQILADLIELKLLI